MRSVSRITQHISLIFLSVLLKFFFSFFFNIDDVCFFICSTVFRSLVLPAQDNARQGHQIKDVYDGINLFLFLIVVFAAVAALTLSAY